MDSKERSEPSAGEKIVRRTRSHALFITVMSVSNLVVGTSMFVEAEGGLIKLGAAFLVLLGAIYSLELTSFITLKRRHDDGAEEKLEVFDDIRHVTKLYAEQSVLKKSRRYALGKALARRAVVINKVSGEKAETATFDLAQQAIFFYAGLLAGLLGACVSVIGMWHGYYPSILVGSIIASVGFVTLACALVSAEYARETA